LVKRIQDHFSKKAKAEGYPARSVYKLQEAQKKYKFLKKGHKVLDLGASPGSWSKYAASIVGKNGRVIAVDLNPLAHDYPNVTQIKADIYKFPVEELKKISECYDVVLSDMAPKTSGRKDVDHLRSISLAERALEIAVDLLCPGGVFFCKVFQGGSFDEFRNMCRSRFKSVKIFKPKSSRSQSVEIFLFCSGLKRDGNVEQ